MRNAVVCTPDREYFRAAGSAAHNIRERPDPARARKQHDELKTLLHGCGSEVIDVPELAGHPNSVFVRDAALCTPAGYIILSMGLPSRRGEQTWMGEILAGLGEPVAGRIESPGTVEGGDVILAGDTAFVGLSSRTNAEGARQISAILRPMGYQVRSAPVAGCHLHIGGGMSVIGPRRVLCCMDEFPDSLFEGFDVIGVRHTGAGAGNVICLAPDEVIADSSGGDATQRELERNGVTVHAVDLSEFRKGAGGPTCLILPVHRSPQPIPR